MADVLGSNRWLGSLPKIGIAPRLMVDPWACANPSQSRRCRWRAVSELLTTNLRHPNGQPVECVIADTTIGGVAKAAACAEKFARAGVGLSITVTPCWCYGCETMDRETSVKMATIARDLMNGNPRRVPGATPVDRPSAQWRFPRSDPQCSFDWNGHL